MASKSAKSKVQPIRPRDLLKPASGPIHPFDQVHGTDTSGLVPARDLVTGHPNDEHVTAYYAVAPSILRSLVEQWKETAPGHDIDDYTFLDMGAGKGRAALLASEFPFREVIGVELNPAMAAIASANAARWQDAHASDPTAEPVSPVRIVVVDALEFSLPTTPTLLFLFHPFEDPVLKQVLRRIESAFIGRAGDLDILYVNAEHGNLISRHPAFKLLWEGQISMSPEDHSADLEAIAQQTEYGSTGDELCAIYRFVGRGNKD
ncbi:MAG TPA: class I SAM-dependent methyltransferase [Edaphobacter sp.]|nr:class I SAM-dependent methyltransferase [Edaphobacter sp.]